MLHRKVSTSKSHYQRKISVNRVPCQQKLIKLEICQKQPIKSLDNKENAKRPQNMMNKGSINKKMLILDRNVNEDANNLILSSQINQNKSKIHKIEALIEIKKNKNILPIIDSKNNQGYKLDNIECVDRTDTINSKIDQLMNIQLLRKKKLQQVERSNLPIRSDSINIRSLKRTNSVVRNLIENRQSKNKFYTLTVTECYQNKFHDTTKQIITKSSRTDSFCQTSITSQGEEYMLAQFNKFKLSDYKFVKNYEQRFNEFHIVCQQTVEFAQRNTQLINYHQQLTCQPREKRIHVLNDELTTLQNNFIHQLGIIKHFDQQKNHLISFMKQSYSQKYGEIYKLTKKLSPINLMQLKQICQDVNQAVMSFFEDFNHFTTKFEQINTNLAKIQTTFYEWSIAINENRLLVYNCIKQIQKMPQMSIKMFGGLQNSIRVGQKFNAQDQIESYLNHKCPKCFDTEKKLNYLHSQNNKIQPILKALDLLLKGYKSKDNLFSPF